MSPYCRAPARPHQALLRLLLLTACYLLAPSVSVSVSSTGATAITRLAAIGDFGADATGPGGAAREAQAAALIQQLDKQAPLHGILALGDTNYPLGAAATIDQNVGKYFGTFMWPLRSNFSSGARDKRNRFFPCPGNHDWYGPGVLGPYLEYMPVGGRRYYDVVLGHVHVFSLDSDPRENALDGTSSTSTQALWLRSALSASSSPWRLVLAHFPPFSSGSHGSSSWMQWPFEEWGATAVLSGHDHTYERLVPGPSGFPYYVNGLGGASAYSFPKLLAVSAAHFTGRPGVQLIQADAQRMQLSFLPASPGTSALNVTALDCYEIVRAAAGTHTYGPCSPWVPHTAPGSPTPGNSNSNNSSDGKGGGDGSTHSSTSGASSTSPDACRSVDLSCSSSRPCCEHLVCHLPESRCGAARAPDFQWMRRRRRQRQHRHLARGQGKSAARR